jgi:hypothetical protein
LVSPEYVACSECVPAEGTMNVPVAVAGDPDTTVPTTSVVPSNVKVTVPVGSVVRVAEGLMVAVTCSEPPMVGVVVAGVTVSVVEVLASVMVSVFEVAAANMVSPLYVACSVCVPVLGIVMEALADSGLLPDSDWVLWTTPSSEKDMVPLEGSHAQEKVLGIVAVTSKVLPETGVVVGAVKTSVVVSLAMV